MPSLFRRVVPFALAAATITLAVVTRAEAQPKPNKDAPQPNAKLAAKLGPIRDAHKVPAVWGAIADADRLLAVAAIGVRRSGDAEPVAVNDKVHLGSCTKALTATVIARLVEMKKLRWDSTIGEVFPDLKDQIHPDFLGVTVTQLLAHQAGLPANSGWLPTPKRLTIREHRRSMLPKVLKDAPVSKPGTKFDYSNSGYVVAGAMAEEASGESWEEMLTKQVFQPLGITTGGFGAPGTTGELDQPWGHKLIDAKLKSYQSDNWPVMGPAGTVHMSLPDWAKFAQLHLRGANGKGGSLTPATFRHLHTPADGFAYAGGWAVGKSGGLTHDGSNTMWHARVRILPKQNVVFLVGINQGGDEAKEACNDAETALREFYFEHLADR